MDLVVYYTNSVSLFFCGGGGEFAVIVDVYCAWVEAIQASIGGLTMSGGFGILARFGKW